MAQNQMSTLIKAGALESGALTLDEIAANKKETQIALEENERKLDVLLS